ncbi:MAG TPA: NlpC/P60 family protein, partial [Bacteroidales bacterium]|nr:NlpC/P60 family protein [Bacteroidales bacterium]
MEKPFRHKIPVTVLLIFIIQLIISNCTKRVYPGPAFANIETHAERSGLKKFLDSGIEKELTVGNTHPDAIIKTAGQYLGVPHCMGGTTTRCMDCSGLLVTVFAKHGIILPHNSEEQARYGRIITGMNELIKGDLVFFIRSYKTNRFITHSGIYSGNNEFIHTSSGKGVTVTS